MDEWLKGVGQLGLAGVIFYFSHKAWTEWATELKEQRDLAQANASTMMQVLRDTAAAITANTITIQALHRRDDQIEDILTQLGYHAPHRVKPPG